MLRELSVIHKLSSKSRSLCNLFYNTFNVFVFNNYFKQKPNPGAPSRGVVMVTSSSSLSRCRECVEYGFKFVLLFLLFLLMHREVL